MKDLATQLAGGRAGSGLQVGLVTPSPLTIHVSQSCGPNTAGPMLLLQNGATFSLADRLPHVHIFAFYQIPIVKSPGRRKLPSCALNSSA